jgi:trehalose synthase
VLGVVQDLADAGFAMEHHPMTHMTEVEITPAPLDQLAGLLAPDRAKQLQETAFRGRRRLEGHSVWNVNSTAAGGGVAEMLATLLAYGRGAGVDTRWLVISGDAEFFTITKRLHNALHGSQGDGGPLEAAEQAHYEAVLAPNLAELRERVRPGDIVLLHDPQTAGLAAGLQDRGVHVIWRCHIGADRQNDRSAQGWTFLRPYAEAASWFVFSRRQYAPSWVPDERLQVMSPSIDPFAVKNHDLDSGTIDRVLRLAGLIRGDAGQPLAFKGRDGSPRVVRPRTGLLWATEPPPPDARLVAQISRWDALKDMSGVMQAFAEQVAPQMSDVHLMLVGPAFAGIADDPESAEVFAACADRWAGLADEVRQRAHLVRVPMDDVNENALIVNAVQRRADVVVQKSLAEGFGLTVTEAMWKGRPIVASAVGGIPDQITDQETGLLVDASDTAAAGRAVRRLLQEPAVAASVGLAAREYVREKFLGDRHLKQYVDLFAALS